MIKTQVKGDALTAILLFEHPVENNLSKLMQKNEIVTYQATALAYYSYQRDRPLGDKERPFTGYGMREWTKGVASMQFFATYNTADNAIRRQRAISRRR